MAMLQLSLSICLNLEKFSAWCDFILNGPDAIFHFVAGIIKTALPSVQSLISLLLAASEIEPSLPQPATNMHFDAPTYRRFFPKLILDEYLFNEVGSCAAILACGKRRNDDQFSLVLH